MCICSNSSGIIESDSLFIREYESIMNKNKRTYFRIIKRNTRKTNLLKSDSLIYVPLIALKRRVRASWDWDKTENNSVFADWSYLELSRMLIDSYIRITESGMEYYTDCRLGKAKRFDRYPPENHLLLFHMIRKYKPDYVFEVNGVPGWFFICDDKILALEAKGGDLLLYENPLLLLRNHFTAFPSWPIFSGDEM